MKTILNLGAQPLANRFTNVFEPNEPRYHLSAELCQSCSLVQLSDVVAPESIYSNYADVTSASTPLLQHLDDLAEELVLETTAPQGSIALDIGCNDGVLLESLRMRHLRAVGVEPSRDLVREVQSRGFDVLESYFNAHVAQHILSAVGPVRIITATNVLTRTHDLHDFAKSVAVLMSDESLFVAEVPYVPKLIETVSFDRIDHEQVYYFMLTPLVKVFDQHGLAVVNLKFTDIHGGSLRIYVKKSGPDIDLSVTETLKREKREWASFEPFADFNRKASEQIQELKKFVREAKARGKTIAGYGASAKGTIRLSTANLTDQDISFVADSISVKQGRFVPGTRIPIVPESQILEKQPDYVLLLAWNYRDEILAKNQDYIDRGGKFVMPVPSLTIL